MKLTYKDKSYTIPKPFDECYFGSKPSKEMVITNSYSNLKTVLPAFAVAIYDTIKGAERTEDYKTMDKGLTWFQKNFTSEYYTLLD